MTSVRLWVNDKKNFSLKRFRFQSKRERKFFENYRKHLTYFPVKHVEGFSFSTNQTKPKESLK